MKKITTLTIIFLILISNKLVFSQEADSFFDKISTKLELYQNKKTPEKIYLHLDKTLYKPGDYIWFKVYLTNGTTHKLNPLSKIAYVELINPKGQIQETKTLIIENGTNYGFFVINEEAKGGLYKIRAYTTWMQNFKEPAIFEKEIIIQKVVTPNILLKLDFDKETYGAGQTVIADLLVKNLKNQPIQKHPVIANIYIDSKRFKKINLETDFEGKLDIKFDLPKDLSTTDVVLNVLIEYSLQKESISRTVPILLNNIDLMFFPEGGDLLAGTNNKLAFKALNEFGQPVDFEAVILDENNNIVQNFKSYYQGMGVCNFTPEKNKTYKAQIIKPEKLDTLFILPKAIDFGFILSLDTVTNNKIQLNIFSKTEQKTYLIATVRDKEYYHKKIDLISGNNKIDISTNDFPSGIVRITLFDKNEIPHCERLVYVGEKEPMKIELKLKKNDYSIEELTSLEIITTQNNKKVSANLSLAIVDDKNLSFADDKQDNILSWFLMSSELKGKIYEPSFYFKKDEEKSKIALDLVLLTHGWRRFSWKEILNEQPTISFLPEQQRNVSGRVTRTKDSIGVKANVWLFELFNKERVAKVETTEDGYFLFTNVDFTSELQIVATYKNKKTNKFEITIIPNSELPKDMLSG